MPFSRRWTERRRASVAVGEYTIRSSWMTASGTTRKSRTAQLVSASRPKDGVIGLWLVDS